MIKSWCYFRQLFIISPFFADDFANATQAKSKAAVKRQIVAAEFNDEFALPTRLYTAIFRLAAKSRFNVILAEENKLCQILIFY